MAGETTRVGVLALQGAFQEHIEALRALGVEAVEVRVPRDLEGCDAVIIPGGESTAIRLLMEESGLGPALRERIRAGMPAMGTCAGMIVLARRVDGKPLLGLDALDIDVRRNAFGRQVDSFEADVEVPVLGPEPFHAVFIRAPVVEKADAGVQVLSRLTDGRVIAVQQGQVVALAFHPELTADDRFHQYFLSMVSARKPAAAQVG